MGRRGPGAGRLKAIAATAPAQSFHPWEKEGMPAAEQVLSFLGTLPIVSGLKAGEMMELLEFQERFVRGVYAETDGERLVRLAGLSVARGNGKSGLLSGLGLAHFVGPMSEPYGECYAAALDREQAGTIYRMTIAYIEAVPWMAARVNIKDHTKEIVDDESRSLWRALTADARKAHSLAPSFWIADEVAQWRSRELWDNLATGMGKRKHALGVTISTQARDDAHFFSEMLDAEPSASTYVQIHTAPEECPLDDQAAWKAANPALGIFVNAEQFADAADRAKRLPSFAPSFRLLHLNQRIEAEGRFVNVADWDANGEPFDVDELEGCRCFGGLDYGSNRDIAALALWFPDEGKLLAWHWVPADSMRERVERDRVPYERWHKEGWLATTAGRATDRLAIALQIADIRTRYDVQAIGYDRWRLEEFEKMLSDQGVTGLRMVPFIQGFKSFAPAMDTFERAILDRKMQHNGSPLLKWQAGNVVIETDPAANRKPAKNKSIDKIDGIVAAIIACGVAAGVTDEQSTDDWVKHLAASRATGGLNNDAMARA